MISFNKSLEDVRVQIATARAKTAQARGAEPGVLAENSEEGYALGVAIALEWMLGETHAPYTL